MPDFDNFFNGNVRPVIYNNKPIERVDYIPFEDEDRFLIKFQKTNSEWRQGIGLSLFGSIEIEVLGKVVKDRVVFFEDTAPREIFIKVSNDKTKRKQPSGLPKKGVLAIKNIWDTGNGSVESWHHGAAMMIEEIEDGKRYWCNDGHPDENFDDIVFTAQKLKN